MWSSVEYRNESREIKRTLQKRNFKLKKISSNETINRFKTRASNFCSNWKNKFADKRKTKKFYSFVGERIKGDWNISRWNRRRIDFSYGESEHYFVAFGDRVDGVCVINTRTRNTSAKLFCDVRTITNIMSQQHPWVRCFARPVRKSVLLDNEGDETEEKLRNWKLNYAAWQT